MKYAGIDSAGFVRYLGDYPNERFECIEVKDDFNPTFMQYSNGRFFFNDLKYKELLIREIENKYKEQLKNGSFFSTSLQENFFCRRFEENNDLQDLQFIINIESLKQNNDEKTIKYITFKNKVNYYSLSELIILFKEMSEYMFNLIQKKLNLLEQINNSNTYDELKNVVWN